jgi:hypothetical protein
MTRLANSMFTAIAVGQGDSFFFQKENITALIDGGKSKSGFAQQFKEVTKRNAVDILVCTHNDADHALGVRGFLEDGLKCKEVWLPGSWSTRLADLLLKPSEFFEELVNKIGTMDLSAETPSPLLESLGDEFSKGESTDSRSIESHEPLDTLWEAIERAEASNVFWPCFLPLPFLDAWLVACYTSRRSQEKQSWFRLLSEAVSAANRIRDISIAAYDSGAEIRWFEYHPSISFGGRPSFLIPVNAREIAYVPKKPWSALEYLALTTVNRESLVFQTAPDEHRVQVLFTADSDLSFSQNIPWSDGMIVTAPHHGSEANSSAYARFTSETKKNLHVIWVRSDGRSRNRPGTSYLRVRGDRFCTLCRGGHSSKQHIRFCESSNRWKRRSTTACSCI